VLNGGNNAYDFENYCPAIWKGTEGAYTVGSGDDKDKVCPYTDDKTGVSAWNRPGCCGGYFDMEKWEKPIYKGGVDTGRKTSCWSQQSADQIPISWLDEDNHIPQRTYRAGEEITATWVSTANHGGMYEWSLICDGDETYSNFRNNRLEVVPGKGGIYESFTMASSPDLALEEGGKFGPKIRDPIVSNGKHEAGGVPHWAYIPQAIPNAALQNVYKIPKDKVEGKFHTEHFRK
jgi:hypothetical protein